MKAVVLLCLAGLPTVACASGSFMSIDGLHDLHEDIHKASKDSRTDFGQCRILSAAWDTQNPAESDTNKANAGYGYKPEPVEDYVLDIQRTEMGTCQLDVLSHEEVNRSSLLQASRPLLIRGATASWAAHKRWDRESLLKTHRTSTFHVGPSYERTLGSLIEDGGYFTGQMGMGHDCYADSGGIAPNRAEKTQNILKRFERQYSPFIATAATDDYSVPPYLLPARMLYMGLGDKEGGVKPEEHPPAWFAAVKGRKRWVLHPPNRNHKGEIPAGTSLIQRPGCGVSKFFTSTLACDQQEGDIMWVPGGWWHETCGLDDFSAGIGGVTFKELEQQQFDPHAKGKCGLGKDAKLNSLLRKSSGGEYSIDEVPYCSSHQCPVVPYPEARRSGLLSWLF